MNATEASDTSPHCAHATYGLYGPLPIEMGTQLTSFCYSIRMFRWNSAKHIELLS